MFDLPHSAGLLLTNNFQESEFFFRQNLSRSKAEVKTVFKEFLASKLSNFNYTGINNLAKFIDVQISYFD